MTVDLRTRAGRAHAVAASVACAECMLPARTRHVIIASAVATDERMPVDLGALAEMTGMARCTVRRYVAAADAACGEDARNFIADVIAGRRPVRTWLHALEIHGGRHGA